MGRIKGKTADWVDTGFKDNTFNLMRKDKNLINLTPDDEQEFKRLSGKYFESRNVYDNRALAQRIGVESATTLAKQELVDKLLDKVWGVQYFTQGFPRKKHCEMGLLDADVELEILEDIKRGDVIIGQECAGVFEAKEEGGILWETQTTLANANLDVYVPRNLVGTFRLCDGDKIKGRMRYVEQLGYNCIFHIDEINGIAVEEKTGRPIITAKSVSPFEKIQLKGNDKTILGLQLFAPICYGQFGIVSTSGRMSFCSQAITLFKAFEGLDLSTHLFIMGEKEHTLSTAKESLGQNSLVYYSTLQDDQTVYLEKTIKSLSLQAKYSGTKHVVIVSNLDMLDKEENGNAVTPLTLASYAGAYDNGGSVTIIAIADSYSPVGAYHIVRNHADFELAYKSGSMVGQSVIDALSSYSFSNREQSKEEMMAIAKLKQLAITEGALAVERYMVSCESADALIKQLND